LDTLADHQPQSRRTALNAANREVSVRQELPGAGGAAYRLLPGKNEMNKKNRARLLDLVTRLRKGERVQMVCTPNVVSVSVTRQEPTIGHHEDVVAFHSQAASTTPPDSGRASNTENRPDIDG
jgi:hypothetical protein